MKRMHVVRFESLISAAVQMDGMGLTVLGVESVNPSRPDCFEVRVLIEAHNDVFGAFREKMTRGKVLY